LSALEITRKDAKAIVWADRIKTVAVLSWTALWLYLSLGMVLLSFSAIQFQAQIENDARRAFSTNVGTQATNNESISKPTVPLIELNHKHYLEDIALLPSLTEQDESSEKVASTSNSDAANRIGETTRYLYPKFFSQGPVPVDVVDAISKKCMDSALDAPTKQQCVSFNAALIAGTAPANSTQLEATHNKLADLRARIETYEQSYQYSEADEIDSHKRMAQFVFPWLTKDILLSGLPHPILVMIVTLSMGALGSALFMLQLHLVGEGGPRHRMSISWHLFRPLQGMATALAIFLLVKAGQISISHSGGSSADDADLNAFVLGFLGVVSGLLSDRAMDRLTAAGVDLLKSPTPRHENSKTPPNDDTIRESLTENHHEQDDSQRGESVNPESPAGSQQERSDGLNTRDYQGVPWTGDGVALPHGTRLRMAYNGLQYEGAIVDGMWLVEGNRFDSPSSAASGVAVTRNGKKAHLHGWSYWEVKRPSDSGWVRLDNLRVSA
jgi:hypothetical protein